jgi:hypothetical protein
MVLRIGLGLQCEKCTCHDLRFAHLREIRILLLLAAAGLLDLAGDESRPFTLEEGSSLCGLEVEGVSWHPNSLLPAEFGARRFFLARCYGIMSN